VTEVANAIEGASTLQLRWRFDSSFHFPLENVKDIVDCNHIDTLGMVQQENTPILKLIH